MRQVQLPEEPLDGFSPVLSKNGRHLLYAVTGPESDGIALKILDLEEGSAREITEDFFSGNWMSFELSGRGGVPWRDGEEFLYFQRQGDRFELRAVPPAGPSRLLRTFRQRPPYSVAVYGDLIAYTYVEGEDTPKKSISLMLARAGDDQARTVLTLDGLAESITWSPDGERLSVDTYGTNSEAPWGLELLVLEIDSSGEVIGGPTLLDGPKGFWSWSPRWLPDGRGLLVQGEDGNVWRISSQPGVRPVEITEALPPNHEVWGFRISPDGRSIAYARSIFRGSSIWRVDLGDALAGFER